jgi:ABC-type transport system involved in cytochrome c biogenesis permease subunit
MELIVVLAFYLFFFGGIVGGIYYLSQWYWQVQRCKAGKESMIEMMERYRKTTVLLIAKESMGTPERIYDYEREIK